MPQAVISPSILSCDFALLAQESKRMEELGAHSLHVDVMDGHFVPNLTLGAPIVKSLRKHTSMPLDCHLMVSEPERWVEDFGKAGANGYTFHIEATKNVPSLIAQIKNAGMKVGIALKPGTNIESVYPFVDQIDLVLIMTVEPGFGGQKLMESCLEKVKVLRLKYPHLEIQVDGGIGVDNIELVAKSGANNIVSGTGVFGANHPGQAIETMTKIVNLAQE
jgi:ribulose-phosphate 3-epimerase